MTATCQPATSADLVKELRGHGVRYFQFFDGANVADETPDYRVDVPDYAQRWLSAARAVVAGGGLPGVGALAPDGDYDDLGFMRQLLDTVKQRGGTDVLGQSWLALRGETPGARPPPRPTWTTSPTGPAGSTASAARRSGGASRSSPRRTRPASAGASRPIAGERRIPRPHRTGRAQSARPSTQAAGPLRGQPGTLQASRA